MSTRRAWVGIDLGTSGVRALVVDDDGEVLAEGGAPLHSVRDGVRHEQDPDEWWRAVVVALGSALGGLSGVDLAGAAVDSTSGTFAILDADGVPVGPGSMYDDGRAGDVLERVNEAGAVAWAAAGYRRMQRSWALPRLVRLLDDGLAPGVRLVHQGDLVNERLVGHRVATDTSSALKTGVDLHGVGWTHDVLAALGVPDAVLPEVVLPGTVLGHVGPDAAAQTGLPAGVPVVAGMTDGCAAQLGAGAVALGSLNAVLGTTLVLKAVAERPVDDPTGVVYSHRSPSGRWLPGGASSVGAGVATRDVDPSSLAALTAAAAGHLPTRVLRYPLNSPGERFPFVAADARDLTVGTPADEAEAFAAVLQGVAYAERLCLDQLDRMGVPLDGPIRITGGGTRNEVWNQLRADVLGRPLELPAHAQPALGMAVLAASAVDGEAIDDVVDRMVRVARTVEPAPTDQRHHEGYLRLVAALEERGWLPGATADHARKRTHSWA